jgi:small-conductance mechanosensitive channel
MPDMPAPATPLPLPAFSLRGDLPYAAWAQAYVNSALGWADANVLVWSTVVQLAVLAGVLGFAALFSRHSAAWFRHAFKDSHLFGFLRLEESAREIFFAAYAALMLWLLVGLAAGDDLPFRLLRMGASLATAWAIIRLTSGTIRSAFWSRGVAVLLLTLAALNIAGWLVPVLAIMDRTGITVNSFHLTLLVAAKGLLSFALLLWAIRILTGVLERSFDRAQGLTPSQKVLFYKLSTVSLYALAFIVGLNIVGLNLAALTAFSGALGLGIGFGMQKVVANLVSGIILLLDKSVKPGDVIALGDTYGWVNTLGARYVSLLTRDGKEHLIPNENLITQEVENWSYSDQKIRIHIPVGVSYGADMHKVKDLLLQAIGDHPRILKEPKPVCFMTGFGDSTVNHELRAWIEDAQHGIANITSDVYYRIWDLFKENGIELPFPQRDVHLKLDTAPLVRKALKQMLDREPAQESKDVKP